MFQTLPPLLLSDVIKGINWMLLWYKSTFIKKSLTENMLCVTMRLLPNNTCLKSSKSLCLYSSDFLTMSKTSKFEFSNFIIANGSQHTFGYCIPEVQLYLTRDLYQTNAKQKLAQFLYSGLNACIKHKR